MHKGKAKLSHLRSYRLAFVPALASVVIVAFSLEGVPAPVEPPPGTTEFDAAGAAMTTRDIIALGASREPGSATDEAAADLVRERFEAVASGAVAEQRVEASIAGEDVELRNVLLTLPGRTDRAIVIVAGRDSRAGPGAPASAAATGLLLELVDQLSISDRDRTLILASTSGASAEAQGAGSLAAALPEGTTVDGVLVISQPGFDEPFEPHLVTASGSRSPPIGLAETTASLLRERSQAQASRTGALGQIARLALPVAAGEQGALAADGLDAVAISSAGEVPLGSTEGSAERFAPESLARFGPAVLAVVAAIDARPEPPAGGPATYLRVGDNLIPGWGVAILALALLLPPAALAASVLAEAARRGDPVRRSLGWAAEWWLPVVALLGFLYLLAVVGVIPGSGSPYDPGRFEVGVSEWAAIALLAALVVSVWWLLGVRRFPPDVSPQTLGAAAGALAVAACALAWIVNPFLALCLLPLTHLTAVLVAGGRRPAGLAVPFSLLLALPLALALLHVAAALDWGASAPWQLVVLAAGGGLPVVEVTATLLTLAAAAAVARAALASGVGPVGGPAGRGGRQSRPNREDPGVRPSARG